MSYNIRYKDTSFVGYIIMFVGIVLLVMLINLFVLNIPISFDSPKLISGIFIFVLGILVIIVLRMLFHNIKI